MKSDLAVIVVCSLCLALLMLALGAGVGGFVTQKVWTDSCEKIGATVVAGQVYVCRKLQ